MNMNRHSRPTSEFAKFAMEDATPSNPGTRKILSAPGLSQDSIGSKGFFGSISVSVLFNSWNGRSKGRSLESLHLCWSLSAFIFAWAASLLLLRIAIVTNRFSISRLLHEGPTIRKYQPRRKISDDQLTEGGKWKFRILFCIVPSDVRGLMIIPYYCP